MKMNSIMEKGMEKEKNIIYMVEENLKEYIYIIQNIKEKDMTLNCVQLFMK